MSREIVDQSARDKIKKELNVNFLVEAGAGSGKTTSLVDRMVNLIATGTCQIHEIVAITFTRKASDELKVRFQTELEKEWKQETNENIKYRLSDALQNIELCFLGTVHSFCAKLLRERPIEAGLDLDFKELEEEDDLELLEESWDLFLRNLQDGKREVLEELDEIGIEVEDLFQSLTDLREYPDVDWVTDSLPKPDLIRGYQSLMNLVREAKKIIPEKEPEKGYDALQKAIVAAYRKARFIDPNKEKDIISVFELFNKKLKPVLNRWPSKEEGKFYEEKFSDLFSMEIEPLIQAWREHCHPVISRFLQEALKEYSRIKRERSLLNFQDLLISAASLLKYNQEVREYFQEKYKCLLVDEFQDTDPIQAEIMFYLTSENTEETVWTKCRPKPGSLFVVGDPKQAIYRFRRADIDTYNRVKELIEEHGGETLQLTMNFRTLDCVTNRLNHVFQDHLPEEENVYQAAYRPLHSFHKDDGTGWTGIMKMTVPKEYAKKEEIIQRDAENIAYAIKQLIDKGFRPKDFMILTRYTEGVPAYAQAVENLKIPASISGEVVIGETKEFQEFSILLNSLVDPTDEISLVAVLRGIFFGISDNELYQWKKANGRFSICSEIPRSLPDTAKNKFQLALSKLQTYSKWVRDLSPVSAITRIMEDSGFYPLLIHNGRDKGVIKSILQIIEALRKQEAHGHGTFKEIVLLFSKMIDEKTIVLNIEEDADAVRVMNVHKAKGLEASIVFLAHPAKRVNPESFLDKHIKREDFFSKGYFAFKARKGFKDQGLGFPLNWDTYKEEELKYLNAEELRIIYVAATRAEKALIISSSEKGNSKNPWETLLELDDLEEVPTNVEKISDPETEWENISLEEFQTETKSKLDWIDGRKAKTYDFWSPTKEKVLSEAGVTERDEGGGLQWGTVIHEVFEKLVKGYEVGHFIKSSLYKHGFSVEREEDVKEAIERLKQSRLWKDLANAEEILTEVPFAVLIKKGDALYERIEKGREKAEAIYVRGVIDLVYKTEEGWVIVDYKTDRPSAKEDFAKLGAFYSNQILFYKEIWERLTSEQVCRTEVFFIYS